MQHLFLCIFFLICFPVLSMSSGVISGAITSQYLLEKSRIVFQVTRTDKQKDPTCYYYYYFLLKLSNVFSPSGQRWKELSHLLWNAGRSSLAAEAGFLSTRGRDLLLPQPGKKTWSSVFSGLCRNDLWRNRPHLEVLSLSLSVFIQGGDCAITGKNDAEDFLRLRAAMEILRFTPDDQSAIFRVLSSVLHLGNVYFQRHEVVFQSHLSSYLLF